jgi:hypothetical protein
MAMDISIVGVTSGQHADVAGTNQLKVILETDAEGNAANIGGIRQFAENDEGLAWPYGASAPYLLSPEVDLDYRQRNGNDLLLDDEHISYNVQNFTKHQLVTTTFVPTFSAHGYTTQATTPLTTAAAASVFSTYKSFTLQGTETLSLDFEMAVTFATGVVLASPIVIECGLAINSASTPYDAFDGIYLRLSNSGGYLVLRNNSTADTATAGPFKAPDNTGLNTWQPVSGRTYQYIMYWHSRYLQFWIADPVTGVTWLAANINTPASLGTPTASPSLRLWLRQYQPTAPAVGAYATLGRYSVRRGGMNVASTVPEQTQRVGENIYSPGTLTTTANQAIASGSITRPAAAVPSNTTSLLASLSGIVLETATEAVNTDVILMSFLNPLLPTVTQTSFQQARRLRIDGIRIASAVVTAFTAGGFAKFFYIAYGSTALSLAGVAADTASTKAYRRVMLELVHAYTATQAAGTLPASNGQVYMAFKNPFFVNPGEYVALCSYHVGTAGVGGVLQHNIAFDYGWE